MKSTITKRELQVADLLARGFTDKEVANKLRISPLTSRSHHSNIYQKTNCRNLADLTRWYFEKLTGLNFDNIRSYFIPENQLEIF